MIFSIRNLGFELGSLLLEGWAAFAARVVCAALLLVLGWLARQLLSRRVCPALLRRSWRLRFYLDYVGRTRLSAADKVRLRKVLAFFDGRE